MHHLDHTSPWLENVCVAVPVDHHTDNATQTTISEIYF